MPFKDKRLNKYDDDIYRREFIGRPGDVTGLDSGLMSIADKAYLDRIRTHSTITSTQTIPDTAWLVLVDASGGDITLTLPEANTSGMYMSHSLLIKRVDESSNNVTLVRAGSDTIEGETSIDIGSGYSIPLESDGSTAWSIT